MFGTWYMSALHVTTPVEHAQPARSCHLSALFIQRVMVAEFLLSSNSGSVVVCVCIHTTYYKSIMNMIMHKFQQPLEGSRP